MWLASQPKLQGAVRTDEAGGVAVEPGEPWWACVPRVSEIGRDVPEMCPRDHPRSPEITGDRPRSPEITRLDPVLLHPLPQDEWPAGLAEDIAALWHEPHGDRQSELLLRGGER